MCRETNGRNSKNYVRSTKRLTQTLSKYALPLSKYALPLFLKLIGSRCNHSGVVYYIRLCIEEHRICVAPTVPNLWTLYDK